MIKSNHTFFLKVLDDILNTANKPTLNYTLTKSQISNFVSPKIVFDKIPTNDKLGFEKIFDKSTENESKSYLIDSALDFLTLGGYLNKHKLKSVFGKPVEYTYQITHKGFLKIHSGFVEEFKNRELEIKNLEKRRIYNVKMDYAKLLIPSFLGALLGALSVKLFS
jgi:hypothetical protein